MKVSFIDGHDGYPYLIAPTSLFAQASLRALKRAFDAEPVLMREGGTISIIHDFQKVLGAQSLMLGLALPDDNAHSPNEKFDLDVFAKGMRMSAYLWKELSAVGCDRKSPGSARLPRRPWTLQSSAYIRVRR